MPVILLRHTTPDVAPGICYGRTDLKLAASFREEFEGVVEKLSRPDRLITSPLTRCTTLAEHLAGIFQLPVEPEPGVIEMDFGTWEGRPWDAIDRAHLDAWARDFMEARPHGGESVRMLQQRTLDTLEPLRQMTETTLVVCHSGVIKAALAEGDKPDDWSHNTPYGDFVTLA